MNIPGWFGLLGTVLAAAAILGAAIAVLRSRYRDKTNEEREKYIAALEARNKLLEETQERQAKEIETVKRKHHNLEGKFCFLQDLVLRQCKQAEIDGATGGCRHCALHLAYGQGGNQ